MHRFILSATVTLVSAMTAFSVADDREQIGEIFGEPVYRDQIRSSGEAARSDLHRLFLAPVLDRYKRAKGKQIELTREELAVAVAYDRANFEERFALDPQEAVGPFAELKRKILPIELQLQEEKGLDESERRRLERERDKLKAQVDAFIRQFSQWHWSNTKFQRHLYSRYGGGRILFQQAGLEAFDAMHRWLQEREAVGEFSISEPALRTKFYDYWTTMEHGPFLSGKKGQSDAAAFRFPWDTPVRATENSEDPGEEAEEPKVAVLDRIEVREIVLRDGKDRPRAKIGFDDQEVLRFSATAEDLQDRFLLSVFPDGRAALIFRDNEGRNRIGLSMREDGRPVMTLDGNATIILHDDRGRNRAVLRTAEDGTPQLSLYDDKMKATVIQPPPAR